MGEKRQYAVLRLHSVVLSGRAALMHVYQKTYQVTEAKFVFQRKKHDKKCVSCALYKNNLEKTLGNISLKKYISNDITVRKKLWQKNCQII